MLFSLLGLDDHIKQVGKNAKSSCFSRPTLSDNQSHILLIMLILRVVKARLSYTILIWLDLLNPVLGVDDWIIHPCSKATVIQQL